MLCSQLRGHYRPFLEILHSLQRNEDQLRDRIRRWPGAIQDRAAEALRFLEAERNGSARRKPQRTRPTALNPAGKSWSFRSAGHASIGR